MGAIVGAIERYRFTPESYLESVVGEIPLYEELQARAATATRVIVATNVLDLGIGTGTMSREVLDFHPGAHLVGIDESEAMLTQAREILPDAGLHVGRLEDPLPPGPFDLVVSALAVHHLDSAAKRDLFRRVRDVLHDDGVFVLADVVVPGRQEDATTPLTPDFDLPDRAGDQLEWLRDAGFSAELVWARGDLAVVRARR